MLWDKPQCGRSTLFHAANDFAAFKWTLAEWPMPRPRNWDATWVGETAHALWLERTLGPPAAAKPTAGRSQGTGGASSLVGLRPL
jgi:hypothetical protein